MSDNMEHDDSRVAPERFDLAEIQRIAEKLWDGRGTIVLTAILSVLVSILYLHAATYTYTTTITLIPTQSQQHDLTRQFSGLASLAGINLSGQMNTVSPFSIYSETAHTRQVAADVMQAWPGVMPILFRDQWDPQTKTWHAPRSFRTTVFDFVKPVLGIPPHRWHPPGPAELQQYILQSVGIVKDKKVAMLTVTLQASDPEFSRRFLLVLHQATDRALRRMTLDRAKKYSAYLENQLTTEQATVVRDVLTQSLSEQETLIMMGSSDTDFAAQPLGPPESSTWPTSPVPILVLFFGLVAGVFVGGACTMLEISLLELCKWLFEMGLNFVSRLIGSVRSLGLG